VVALAVLFVGIAVWQPRASDYILETVIGHEGTSPPGGTDRFDQQVLQELTSDAFLGSVVDRLDPGLRQTANQTQVDHQAWADFIRTRLRVSIGVPSDSVASQIRLRFIGRSKELSRVLLDEMAELFVKNHDDPVADVDLAGVRVEAENTVRSWSARMDVYREQLEEVMADELNRRRLEFAQGRWAGGAAASEQVIEPVPNPKWIELNGRLTEQQNRIQGMLASLTADHPRVQAAMGDLEEISAALQATPRLLAPDESADSDRAAVVPERLAVPQAPFDEQRARAEIAATSKDYVRRRDKYEEAKRRHDESQRHLESIVLALNRPRERARVLQPAEVVERRFDSLAPPKLGALLIASIAMGLGCVVWQTGGYWSSTIDSIPVAERLLGIRAIAAIPTGDGPAIPPANSISGSVRKIVRIGELVLGVAALLVTAAFLTLPDFGRQFIDNPFAALAAALDHVGEHLL
jgi:hypothetical protein